MIVYVYFHINRNVPTELDDSERGSFDGLFFTLMLEQLLQTGSRFGSFVSCKPVLFRRDKHNNQDRRESNRTMMTVTSAMSSATKGWRREGRVVGLAPSEINFLDEK